MRAPTPVSSHEVMVMVSGVRPPARHFAPELTSWLLNVPVHVPMSGSKRRTQASSVTVASTSSQSPLLGRNAKVATISHS